MAIKHLGNAFFIDDRPITPKDWLETREARRKMAKRWGSATHRALEWLDQAADAGKKISIHPYAEFHSLERASMGVALIEGDKVVDSIELKETSYSEPIARYLPHDLIASELKDAKPWMFEEMGWVEVTDKDDWDLLREAHEGAYKREVEDTDYQGPGLYDGRDMQKVYGSVEELEISDMESEADSLIDYMFSGGLMGSDLQGNEWIEAFEKLALKAADEDEEDDWGGTGDAF